MLDDSVFGLATEIAVQDKVAIEYEQKRYNNKYSSQYHQWWTQEMLAGLNVAGRVLDNGCGVGLLSDYVAKDRIIGFDISSEMLKRASISYSHVVLGNSQLLPFKKKSFDLVVCRSLLHHLQNPGVAVSEMARVLDDNAEFVLADTNTSVLSCLPRIIAKHGEHFSEDHENMSFSKLKRILEPYFKITEAKYFGYIAYPLIGFPDLVSIFQFFPCKTACYNTLMKIDNVLSMLPFLKTQSWGIIIKGKKL
jgi:ubiquinone/menaquinone biosynthesis C-methylase UbiE